MEVYPGKPRKRSEAERNATKMLITTSVLTLALLVFIPMWNSYYLWKDPIYTYFGGTWIPRGVFVNCTLVWVIGLVTVNIFFIRIPFEGISEGAVLSLAAVFLTLIGVVLTLYANPLQRQASTAYMELWGNCQYGAQSRPLMAVSQQLQILRAIPGCANQTSIEQCISFKDYPYLDEVAVLKAMENLLSCSGFCYTPPTPVNTTFIPYPPTLFSQNNYQVSCEGAAARHIRFFVASSATSFMQEGVFLILVSVAVGLLKLISYCRGSSQEAGERVFYADDPSITEKRVIYGEEARVPERSFAYGAL